MRRIALLTLCILFILAATSFAKESDKAIDSGNFVVGAQTNILNFAHPSVDAGIFGGYFVADGFEVGPVLTIMYSSSTSKTDYTRSYTGGAPDADWTETDTTTTNFYGLGIQGGYFHNTDTIVVPYGMLMIEYVTGASVDKSEIEYKPSGGASSTDTQTYKSDSSGFRITPKAGAMFFLTKNFAIDTSIFMRYASMSGSTTDKLESEADPTSEYEDKGDFTSTDTDFGLSAGFNFFF